MTVILTTTDGPYPTTNSPSLTTNLALNIYEALRRTSLCETRDVKDEDRQVFWTPGLFSGKQLIAAMCLELRNRSPCLMPWMDRACCARNICNGFDGREVVLTHCGGKQARDQKAVGDLTSSTWCKCSPHGRWQYTFYFIPFKCYGRAGWSELRLIL